MQHSSNSSPSMTGPIAGSGIDILHEFGDPALSGSKKSLADVRTLQTFDHEETLLPSWRCLNDGSTVRRQHKQDIVDPPSIIELFQEHPPDIPAVGTMELICMHEAVSLLVWPGLHVVAVTQNHPGRHRQACRVHHGFHKRPL